MSDEAMYKIPTIDLSVPSLLALAQLGVFAAFTYWGSVDASGVEYLFPVITGMAGLALFLSVPHARMIATFGLPAAMCVLSVVLDDPEMIFWAVFMLIMVGGIAYLPAMALNDEALGLDEEAMKNRLGPLWVLFALFTMFMFGTIDAALEGEFLDEDSEGTEIVTELDSDQQTIAQAGLAIGLIGVVVFLMTGVMGMEVGPMRPWHGGALASGALFLTMYLWMSTDSANFEPIPDIGMILAISGILTLVPCAAYEGSES